MTTASALERAPSIRASPNGSRRRMPRDTSVSYLRPDGAKTSFVPLLEAINRITPRDPETGRLVCLVRPVYVSPMLTKLTGITMGFLRFKRWAWCAWKAALSDDELLVAYEFHRLLGAVPLRSLTHHRRTPTGEQHRRRRAGGRTDERADERVSAGPLARPPAGATPHRSFHPDVPAPADPPQPGNCR